MNTQRSVNIVKIVEQWVQLISTGYDNVTTEVIGNKGYDANGVLWKFYIDHTRLPNGQTIESPSYGFTRA